MGSLELAIGHLADEVKKAYDQNQKEIPDFINLTQTVIAPTPTANFAIDMGHPPAGKYWEVKCVSVGGADISQNGGLGGATVYLCRGQVPTPPTSVLGGLASLSTVFIRDWNGATSVPWSKQYGRREIIIPQFDHLFFVVNGGTAASAFAANVDVLSYNEFVRTK